MFFYPNILMTRMHHSIRQSATQERIIDIHYPRAGAELLQACLAIHSTIAKLNKKSYCAVANSISLSLLHFGKKHHNSEGSLTHRSIFHLLKAFLLLSATRIFCWNLLSYLSCSFPNSTVSPMQRLKIEEVLT